MRLYTSTLLIWSGSLSIARELPWNTLGFTVLCGGGDGSRCRFKDLVLGAEGGEIVYSPSTSVIGSSESKWMVPIRGVPPNSEGPSVFGE